MPSALTDGIPLLTMTSHASNARHEFIWTGLGCSPLTHKAGLVLYLKHCFSFTSNKIDSPSYSFIKALNKSIQNVCCLLNLGPQSKCGNCYYKQASKTVMLCIFMTDSWKMLHIQVACHNRFFFIHSSCH